MRQQRTSTRRPCKRLLTCHACKPPAPAEYKTGETFWSATDTVRTTNGLEGPGMYVVLSGVIRRVHHRPDGTKKVGGRGLSLRGFQKAGGGRGPVGRA